MKLYFDYILYFTTTASVVAATVYARRFIIFRSAISNLLTQDKITVLSDAEITSQVQYLLSDKYGESVSSIPLLDNAVWLSRASKEPLQKWTEDFWKEAVKNLINHFSQAIVSIHYISSIQDGSVRYRYSTEMEPVLQLIIDQLISEYEQFNIGSDFGKGLQRFGISDSRKLVLECFDGNQVIAWVGRYRGKDQNTWLMIENYLFETKEIFSLLLIRYRSGVVEHGRNSQRMLQQVSHDIRSPLNNIKAALSVAEDRVDEDAKSFITIAQRNLESVSELTETILDYSVHSAGCMISQPEEFILMSAIAELINRYSLAASMKGLSLSADVHPEIAIRFDKKQFTSILSNLLSNAIKYSNNGTVLVQALSINNQSLQIKVVDQGIGFTSEQLKDLYTPFTRFHRHIAEGTGLGLTLTKQLVELNGSKLEVKSVYQKGTTFTFLAPLVYLPAKLPSIGKNISKTKRTIKILLIEDDKDLANSYLRNLEGKKFKILHANNFPEAQNIVNLEPIDAIITDAETGIGSLEDFLEYLKAKEIHAPCLLISGKQIGYIPSRVSRVIRKPADIEEIRQWVEESISSECTTLNAA